VLSSYVPRFQLERLARLGTAARACVDVEEGAVLYLDVSGFTRLTDEFDRRGPEGAEALATALHRYFVRVVDVIAARGGDVVAFAGDAAIVLFRAHEHGSGAGAARAAAAAAVAVQDALAGWEPAPGVALRTRAGVGAGELRFADVGGHGGRWESLVAGPAMIDALDALAAAAPGEAIATAAVIASLEPADRREPRARGQARLVDVSAPPATELVVPAPVSFDALRAIVPPPVALAADAGGGSRSRWLAEFRPVTALFAVMPTSDWSATRAIDGLQASVVAMQRAIVEHDGAPYQLLVDDKGTTLVAAFGLPPHAASDDATRAVAAAIALRRELAAVDARAGIGVASGRLFTGAFGTAFRAHFALRGGAMNLASRLAALAPGDVRCDAATARAAAKIAFERLPPVRVKGLAEPVDVARPMGALTAGTERRAVVGRAHERAVLGAAVEAAADPGDDSGLWVIVGEPAIGKSLLLGDTLARTAARGVPACTGLANAIERATAYYAWRDIVAEALGEQAEAPPEQLRAALAARLVDAPGLVPRAPVLGAILPFGLPDTPETRDMDAAARADSVEDLVTFILATPGTPLVVLDDAHWLDSASIALARAVLRRVPGLVMIVASRPIDERAHPDLAALFASARGVVRLEPLVSEDVHALLSRRLGGVALDDDLVSMVMQRTDGRPYFAEELAVAMRDAGAIVVEEGRARLVAGAAQAFRAAASLEAVLRERLDRLPPREQLVVRTASAIGHIFPDQMLVDIHPIDEDRPIIPSALDHLQETDVLRPVDPPPGGEHAFKHVTMQQVAYDTLLFEQRRELHRRAAIWYEARHEDLRPLLPLLAHHWRGAEDGARAIDYLERAAEEALRTFSNREAIGFLTEAQAVATRVGLEVAPARAARWERWLGEASIGMARVGDARGHLLRALELRGVAPPGSKVRMGGGLLAEIARHVARGRGPLEPPAAVGDAAAERDAFAAGVYHSLSEVFFFQHEQLALLHSTFASLNAAQRTGAVRETVNGLGSVGYAAALVGLRGVARRYRDRSLALAEEKGTLPVVAFAHQIAATLDNALGDSDEAERSCARAEEIFGRLGDRFRWESVRSIHGYTYLARGTFAAALAAFAAVLESAGPDGAVQTRAWATAGTILATVPARPLDPAWIGRARALLALELAPAERLLLGGAIALAERDRGHDDAAHVAAVEALAVLEVTPPVTSYTLWSTAAIADVLTGAARDGRAARAVELLARAARALPAGAPLAALARARLADARGKRRAATRGYRDAAAAAERLRMPYEHALALAGLGQRASAATILEQLGAARDAAKLEAGVKGKR